jgi:predicted Zn-dependent protease
MALGRASLDDRYFGRAETLLRGALPCVYRKSAGLQFDRCVRETDAEALLAYADLLQHGHDFAAAERALDQLLARDATNARARLMRASIRLARGDPQQALGDCKRLILTGGAFVASVCIAQAIGLNGKLADAISLIETLDFASMPGESRAWALSILADLYERRGNSNAAIATIERALLADERSVALEIQAVDLFLRHGKARRAGELLHTLPDAAAVILRRARVAKELQQNDANELRDRWFALAVAEERLGIATHGRDRAIGELHLMNRPADALRFALANWQQNRDIEDARIAIAAAEAADVPDAASQIRAWLQSLQVEDAIIAASHGRRRS